jgi:hypothetical protein
MSRVCLPGCTCGRHKPKPSATRSESLKRRKGKPASDETRAKLRAAWRRRKERLGLPPTPVKAAPKPAAEPKPKASAAPRAAVESEVKKPRPWARHSAQKAKAARLARIEAGTPTPADKQWLRRMEEPVTVRCGRCGWSDEGPTLTAGERFRSHRCKSAA